MFDEAGVKEMFQMESESDFKMERVEKSICSLSSLFCINTYI